MTRFFDESSPWPILCRHDINIFTCGICLKGVPVSGIFTQPHEGHWLKNYMNELHSFPDRGTTTDRSEWEDLTTTAPRQLPEPLTGESFTTLADELAKKYGPPIIRIEMCMADIVELQKATPMREKEITEGLIGRTFAGIPVRENPVLSPGFVRVHYDLNMLSEEERKKWKEEHKDENEKVIKKMLSQKWAGYDPTAV